MVFIFSRGLQTSRFPNSKVVITYLECFRIGFLPEKKRDQHFSQKRSKIAVFFLFFFCSFQVVHRKYLQNSTEARLRYHGKKETLQSKNL